MPNLYELTEDIQSLQNAFETGDIPEDAFTDTLEGLQMGFDQKVENICKWVMNLKADAAAHAIEKKRQADLEKSASNQADRLKAYLQSALKATKKDKVKAGTFTASIAKSPVALNVFDEKLIPDNFYVQPPKAIDNVAVKEALKSGQTIPGAELKQGEYLKIK